MAKSQTWFGTKNDLELIVGWLKVAGATLIDGSPLKFDGAIDGGEFAVHFPAIGSIKFWPTKIRRPELGDNSSRAKRAFLALLNQKKHPGRPEMMMSTTARSRD